MQDQRTGPNPSGLCQCGCGQRTKLAHEGCTRLGWVKDQPIRFIFGHHLPKPTVPQYEVRDCGYKTPCWVWLRGLSGHGYGTVKDPRRGRTGMAHKVIWERENGPVPDGLELDHLCRVRACVNPDHLEAVTHRENNRRGVKTKLTVEQVTEILAADHRYGNAAKLAARYGVSKHTIYGIRRGLTWKELPR